MNHHALVDFIADGLITGTLLGLGGSPISLFTFGRKAAQKSTGRESPASQ